MKVLLINGSPHAKGCTYTALKTVAAVYGGGRHTWRLQLIFHLVKREGRWLFSAASASTY